jgi:hypothetical protein
MKGEVALGKGHARLENGSGVAPLLCCLLDRFHETSFRSHHGN